MLFIAFTRVGLQGEGGGGGGETGVGGERGGGGGGERGGEGVYLIQQTHVWAECLIYS